MLDSIKDWFVDRLHKYMDAAREIVENDEGIRSAETYYSTVKATLKRKPHCSLRPSASAWAEFWRPCCADGSPNCSVTVSSR